jgi:hypothetical protein
MNFQGYASNHADWKGLFNCSYCDLYVRLT